MHTQPFAFNRMEITQSMLTNAHTHTHTHTEDIHTSAKLRPIMGSRHAPI